MAPKKQMTLDSLFGRGKAVGGVKKAKRDPPVKLLVSHSSEKVIASSAPEVKLEVKPESSEQPSSDENVVPSSSLPVPAAELPRRFAFKSLLKDFKWRTHLRPEFEKPYVKDIQAFLEKEEERGVKVFPPRQLIFNAFNQTPFDEIRVVILGQDPYHDNGQAHGLCFSVPPNMARLPPSLVNIFNELESDLPPFKRPSHGCLEGWATQGVFLLNATLTVRAHEANSHANIGWQKFTDEVIRIISRRSSKGVVFLLWGQFAKKKDALIDGKKHVIVKAAHPSPLSYSKFKGCRCFSAANEALKRMGRPPIDWSRL